ncbi:hypothetical protein SAMN04487943_10682 [Gracilibacillus orientalis]|uniref:SdpI/YhfL protein family protein n=1 Tax=Gracilibacillus orientalis TaxID=334253 RepID=A0A1I4M823_9BACI|nr:hypothetical protein [Gracilibacillus orientalis]SFL99379.1 hypothetical protein SAMN04487943_10682 [Gracilibacillus orientalis]
MNLFITLIIVPLVFIAFIGYFTGSKEFILGPNDDERKKSIKQKSIVQSWATIFLFLLTNFLFDLFNLQDERLSDIPFVFPELFYLIILVVSYFIFLVINNKKISA